VHECSFDFTNASLKKPLSVGLMEPGLWPVAPDEFESGGGLCAGNFFVRDGQYSLASLLFAVHGALWSRRHYLWLCSGWQ